MYISGSPNKVVNRGTYLLTRAGYDAHVYYVHSIIGCYQRGTCKVSVFNGIIVVVETWLGLTKHKNEYFTINTLVLTYFDYSQLYDCSHVVYNLKLK